MAYYAISGVWKDENDVITDYAIHTWVGYHIGLGKKYSKAQAIALLSNTQNSATTIVWNYNTALWSAGASVHVDGFGANRYLRTQADSIVGNNLDNLINYGWITDDFIE